MSVDVKRFSRTALFLKKQRAKKCPDLRHFWPSKVEFEHEGTVMGQSSNILGGLLWGKATAGRSHENFPYHSKDTLNFSLMTAFPYQHVPLPSTHTALLKPLPPRGGQFFDNNNDRTRLKPGRQSYYRYWHKHFKSYWLCEEFWYNRIDDDRRKYWHLIYYL